MDRKAEKFIFAEVKAFNAETNELDAVASTEAMDRDNEIIEAEAWRTSLPAYRANPVVLATHLHRTASGASPVIGSAVRIDVEGRALAFRLKFAGTELGREYGSLYRDRHMRAFSVGFYPVSGEWREFNRDGKRVPDGTKGAKRVWVHTEVELWEISAVPVPSNPEALARMRAAGLFGGGLAESDVPAAEPDPALAKAIAEAVCRQLTASDSALRSAFVEIVLGDLQSEIRNLKSAIEELVICALPDPAGVAEAGPVSPAASGAPDPAGEGDGDDRDVRVAEAADGLRRTCTT